VSIRQLADVAKRQRLQPAVPVSCSVCGAVARAIDESDEFAVVSEMSNVVRT